MRHKIVITALLLSLAACATAPQQDYYVEPASIQPSMILPPFPPEGSAADQADIAAFNAREANDQSDIWHNAYRDADGFGTDYMFEIFAPALGVRLTEQAAPATFALLEKTYRNMAPIMDGAKRHFNRSRPIYRFNISRFCNTKFKVQTEWGDSYPSGHAMRGWQVGLLLAEIVPDKAPDILARAAQYGDNRVVCRVHYPSDIDAGRLLAGTYIERLQTSPDFRSDLAAARREIESLRSAD